MAYVQQYIPYQDYTTPMNLPWQYLASTLESKQNRYDTANLLANKKFDDLYSQEYRDPYSREKFLQETESKFSDIWDKYDGDMGRAYSDVLDFSSKVSRHPYLQANKKQLAEYDRLAKMADKYGENLVVTQPLTQSLYNEQEKRWLRPDEIKFDAFEAPDYYKNSMNMMQHLKGDAGSYGLTKDQFDMLKTGNWEAITPEKRFKIISDPRFLEAWKKNNPGWDKDVRPQFNKWGNTPQEQNQNIANYVMGITGQMDYTRTGTRYMADPQAAAARKAADTQTMLQGLQGLQQGYKNPLQEGDVLNKYKTGDLNKQVLPWYMRIPMQFKGIKTQVDQLSKLIYGTTSDTMTQDMLLNTVNRNTVEEVANTLGKTTKDLTMDDLADFSVNLAYTNPEEATKLRKAYEQASRNMPNNWITRNIGLTNTEEVDGQELYTNRIFGTLDNLITDTYNFRWNPEYTDAAMQTISDWTGGQMTVEQLKADPNTFRYWGNMAKGKLDKLQFTDAYELGPEMAESINYSIFGKNTANNIKTKEATFRIPTGTKIYTKDTDGTLQQEGVQGDPEILKEMFSNAEYVNSKQIVFYPKTKGTGYDSQGKAMISIIGSDGTEVLIENPQLTEEFQRSLSIEGIKSNLMGVPTNPNEYLDINKPILIDPATKEQYNLFPIWRDLQNDGFYELSIVPNVENITPTLIRTSPRWIDPSSGQPFRSRSSLQTDSYIQGISNQNKAVLNR